MNSIFDPSVAQQFVHRINALTSTTQAVWGTMQVAQNALLRFILTRFIKPAVVGSKPYPKSSRTAPAFLIKTSKDFNVEQARLIAYINTTVAHGASFFEGKESLSFGKLTSAEWNVMFHKHLDHHLRQFGV